MDTKKYTKEELAERAKGVFRSNKSLAAVYASENGTFLNAKQYEAARKEGKHTGLIEIKNPAAKVMLIVDESAKDAEIAELKKEVAGKDARIAELSDEISGYEHLKVENEKLQIENAKLRSSINGPSAPLADAKPPKATRKSSTKPAKS